MAEPLEIPLANGRKIVSGWIDGHDPDALPAGDWLSVEDENGNQIFYEETADIAADPVNCRRIMYDFIRACRGETPL